MCGLGLAGLLLSGCASTPPQTTFAENVPGAPGAPAVAPANPDNIDIVQAGQPLTITFTDLPQPQMPIQDQVKQDGSITLLLNKTFMAAGKTRRQLEQEVHDYYVPGIFRQMTVSMQGQPQSRFYFVDGEVKQPGRQVYIGPMTVLKAVASAGGCTDFSNKGKVKLIHPDGRTKVINIKQALDKPELDLPVYPDDKIYVPRRLFW
jgi:polysaccharide biosynthesis/export protein